MSLCKTNTQKELISNRPLSLMRSGFRFIRILILWLFGSVIALVLAGVSLAYIYEEDIRAAAVAELNKQLEVPVQVGKIDFSVLSHFPYASITLPDVQVNENVAGSKRSLLDAAEISLLFNIKDIFAGHYTIKQLYVAHGSFNGVIDQKGRPNYIIWKEKKSSGSLSLKMESIILEDMRLQFHYLPADQHYATEVHKANLSGKFSESQYTLNIESDLLCKSVRLADLVLLKEEPIQLALKLAVDARKEQYRFTDASIELPGLKLAVEGLVAGQSNGVWYDVVMQEENLGIAALIERLPQKYKGSLGDYSSDGNCSVSLAIKGLKSATKNPTVSAFVSLKNGTLKGQRWSRKLEDIELRANFTTGKGGSLASCQLQIESFSAAMQGKPIEGHLNLINFEKPQISIGVNGDFLLEEWSDLIQVPGIKAVKGLAHVACNSNGLISDLESTESLKKLNFTISVEDLSFDWDYAPYHFEEIKGRADLKGDSLLLRSLGGKAANMSFLANGVIPSIISSIKDKKSPFVRLDLSVPYLSIEQLFAGGAEKGKQKVDFSIGKELNIQSSLTIGQLDWGSFTSREVHTRARVKDQKIVLDDLKLKTLEGSVSGKVLVDAEQPGDFFLKAQTHIEHLNIQELFKASNNFGQNKLVAENLKGLVTADLNLVTVWRRDMTLVPEKLYCEGELLIENGALNDFEPLLALSNYADVNELKRLRFATLKNSILITDRTIYIPEMLVKNNVIDLSLSGHHTFDNTIDYSVNMLLSDVLNKRFRLSQKVDEDIPVEQENGPQSRIYIRMTGAAASPKIALDRDRVKNKVASDIQKEKKQVGGVLRDEFKNMFKGGAVEKEELNGTDWEKDIPQKQDPKRVTAAAGKEEGKDPDPKTVVEDPKKKKGLLQRLKDQATIPIDEE